MARPATRSHAHSRLALPRPVSDHARIRIVAGIHARSFHAPARQDPVRIQSIFDFFGQQLPDWNDPASWCVHSARNLCARFQSMQAYFLSKEKMFLFLSIRRRSGYIFHAVLITKKIQSRLATRKQTGKIIIYIAGKITPVFT